MTETDRWMLQFIFGYTVAAGVMTLLATAIHIYRDVKRVRTLERDLERDRGNA